MGGSSVRGGEQLRAGLDAAARELAQLDAADDDAGELLADAVRAAAPRRTGHMADTVTHVGATVTVGAPYALFVHARNPWAARELETRTARILSTYEDAIADAVARIGD